MENLETHRNGASLGRGDAVGSRDGQLSLLPSCPGSSRFLCHMVLWEWNVKESMVELEIHLISRRRRLAYLLAWCHVLIHTLTTILYLDVPMSGWWTREHVSQGLTAVTQSFSVTVSETTAHAPGSPQVGWLMKVRNMAD